MAEATEAREAMAAKNFILIVAWGMILGVRKVVEDCDGVWMWMRLLDCVPVDEEKLRTYL